MAAEEVRANAARGFHAVTFPESPHRLGLPSLHSDHWVPLFAACEETGTVICIHAGSSGISSTFDPAAPGGVVGPMFAISQCLNTTIEWPYSGVAIRFPSIKVCLSEGGIGWVVALLDRLDHSEKFRSAPVAQVVDDRLQWRKGPIVRTVGRPGAGPAGTHISRARGRAGTHLKGGARGSCSDRDR